MWNFLAPRPTILGVKDGRLAPCPCSPNCVSTQAQDGVHASEPLRFTGTPDDAKRRLKAVIDRLPRSRLITETADYVYAECRSRVFRFVDDVEFWIDPSHQVIHFRSASRLGYSDLGVNRKRMEQVRQAFDAQG